MNPGNECEARFLQTILRGFYLYFYDLAGTILPESRSFIGRYC
jgi:hypothetical protein